MNSCRPRAAAETVAFNGFRRKISNAAAVPTGGSPLDVMYRIDGGRKRFTHSRLMCWVAIDRAMRIATNRGLPADLARWRRVRDDIFAWIMVRG
jgi:hypothetical protein